LISLYFICTTILTHYHHHHHHVSVTWALLCSR